MRLAIVGETTLPPHPTDRFTPPAVFVSLIAMNQSPFMDDFEWEPVEDSSQNSAEDFDEPTVDSADADDPLPPGVMWPSQPDAESPPAAPFDSDAKMARCEAILDYRFADQKLLRSALTHSSGADTPAQSNERLEFFGDAVLGLIVCQFLFETYPSANEGDLTKIKSAVVSRRSCGKVALRLGLDECLIVGRGVIRNRGYPKSLISDVFESIIGALYLDAGRGRGRRPGARLVDPRD